MYGYSKKGHNILSNFSWSISDHPRRLLSQISLYLNFFDVRRPVSLNKLLRIKKNRIIRKFC